MFEGAVGEVCKQLRMQAHRPPTPLLVYAPTQPPCMSKTCKITAGGDSVSAVKQLQPVPDVSFISTGGGASLELIRGTLLPGIQALAQAVRRQKNE